MNAPRPATGCFPWPGRAGVMLLALLLLSPAWAGNGTLARCERAMVTLEITRTQYDYAQPWSRRAVTVTKAGMVLADRRVLTTAADLADRTVIRAQRNGRGQWFEAKVAWVDYAANLALLTVDDATFWTGLKPLAFARTVPRDGDLRIVRWRGGSLEVRKAEFNRFRVNNPNIGEAAHVVLELSSEIDGTGWGELALAGQRVIGLVYGQLGNTCHVLPAPYIESILSAQARGTFRGMGYFDFTWQPTENPETLRYLKVPGTGRGVVVIEVPERPALPPVLKPRDVLLQVDGFDIDNEGDYEDPLYGHLMLENLSTRNRGAGDRVRLKVWRDGRALDLEYVLPRLKDAARLVPEGTPDRPPEYLIVGGLVFQPLTRDYLRSWGQDWERTAPFRLAYFRNEEPSTERPSLLILSMVLPDAVNLGYHDVRTLVLEKANGRRVSRLQELEAALNQPESGLHRFEFLKGETLQRLVLDASSLAAANRRILDRYGIEKDREVR